LTRSWIIDRSNSANTPSIWNIAWPEGGGGVHGLLMKEEVDRRLRRGHAGGGERLDRHFKAVRECDLVRLGPLSQIDHGNVSLTLLISAARC
jgi:hypothetical protein